MMREQQQPAVDRTMRGTEGHVVADDSFEALRRKCLLVCDVTSTMVTLVSERVQLRRDSRRSVSHIRQVAMYICHVVLGMRLGEIARCLGLDRTTVSHACNRVEDRRDDPAYDRLVDAVEQTVMAIFETEEGNHGKN